jgi:carbon monoxide dehydrogenase subunit G
LSHRALVGAPPSGKPFRMAQFSSTINVDASPDEAFAFLSDLTNRPEWDPSVRSVAVLDGGRFAVTVGFYGKAIETTYEVVESDGPKRIVFEGSGKMKARDVIEIVEREGGSSVTMDLNVTLKGAARMLDRGLQLAFAGIGDNAAKALKGKLDA